MPVCDQVQLLLGPFADGELEPHEMEDVALHVVSCLTCKASLEAYHSLGVALRDCVPPPPADGFTVAVLKRIEHVPQPLRLRIRRRLDAIAEHVSAGFALVDTGAVAALVTFVVARPYVSGLLEQRSPGALASAAVPTLYSQPSPGPGIAEIQHGSIPIEDWPLIVLSDDPTTTVLYVPNQP